VRARHGRALAARFSISSPTASTARSARRGPRQAIDQALRAGVVDELIVHIAPIFLGTGRRLFEEGGPRGLNLSVADVIGSLNVTHLRYRVEKA
jgi:hypothetical protein